MTCDHKFIDTNYCAKCGASVDTIRTRSSYPDDVVAVMRDTIAAQRGAIAAQRELIGELEASLEAARAEACREPYLCWKEIRAQIAAARTLLEDASGAIDEACYPVWWEQWRQFLNREGVAT